MNRLQKKCFIASAGTHLLLALILFVGPAFLARNDRVDNSQILEFIPVMTTDAPISGGGNPHGGAPPAALPQPPPQPRESRQTLAPPEKAPDPPKSAQKQESESFESKQERKPRLPTVSTKIVTRSSSKMEKQTPKSDDREQQMADARRRTAAALAHAAANIGNDLSGSTSVELKGPGGGGVPYANFLQAVKTVYSREWVVPDGANDGATISVSVTIARDGTVASSRITRRSGDRIADASVELLLERVRFVAPLPPGAKEDERIVTIDFSVKAQRLLG